MVNISENCLSLKDQDPACEAKATLKQLEKCGMLDSAMWDVIKKMAREKILENHHYSIWQGLDGRWYTKIKTKDGLRNIKKTKYEDLIDSIIKYHDIKDSFRTLEQIFPQFLKNKVAETSEANGIKLQWVWKKYYAGTKIANTDLSTLTTKAIKNWFLSVIEEKKMDKRHYIEFKGLINMMMDFAVEDGIIKHNPAREIHKIGKKHFYEKEEKSYDEQVFRKELIEELIPLCFKQFKKTGNTAYYAIVLNFHLGLRVGELVALKTSDFDFDSHILRIRRMEKTHHYYDEDGVIHRDGYEIANYTKSKDGIRNLVLTPEAEIMVKLIMEKNPEDSEWLFVSSKTGVRIKNDAINNVLRRLNKKLDTEQKSNHCIRKTNLSNLFKYNFMEDEVRRFAGHSDSSTTHRYYEFAEANNAENLPAYSNAFHSDALTEILSEMERDPSGTRVGPKNPDPEAL